MTNPLPLPLSVELRLHRAGLDIQAQFRVPPGYICALVGRPGAGKTALLHGAAGLVPTDGGRVTVGTTVLYDDATGVNRPPEERRFASVDSRGLLFPHLNVEGNLRYAAKRAPAHKPGPTLEALVEWLHLKSLLTLWPARLTPTQRQHVALARALLSCPNALFLHDPMLEIPTQDHEAYLGLLAEAKGHFKIPTVLITPRIDDVVRLADEVVILHEGRVASAGSVSRILSDVSLSTFLEGAHAGCVLEGQVRQHDIQWLLSEVDIEGQRVTVPAVLQSEGKRVRLKLRARDVNVHLKPLKGTSVTNQLRGRITQVMLAGHNGSYGAVSVELHRLLDANAPPPAGGGEQVWALLTRRSIQRMDLTPGLDCYVSFKAMAVAVTPLS